MLLTIPPEIAKKMGTYPALSHSEYEAERANWYNKSHGSLEGPNCTICLNKGFIAKQNEKGEWVDVECSCMVERLFLIRAEKINMKDMMDELTFDKFQTTEPWQAAMKRKAQAFVADKSGKWFAAMGSVGAGKTHICTAICGKLLKAGMDVRYMRWRNEGTRLKATVNNCEEYDELIRPLKEARVLYIDDLFKTQAGKEITQGDINLAFELIDHRYGDRRLITIISSEYTIEEIIKIDSAVGSRIFERSKDYYLCLTGNKNRRLQ